jgi:hypothetical protein
MENNLLGYNERFRQDHYQEIVVNDGYGIVA